MSFCVTSRECHSLSLSRSPIVQPVLLFHTNLTYFQFFLVTSSFMSRHSVAAPMEQNPACVERTVASHWWPCVSSSSLPASDHSGPQKTRPASEFRPEGGFSIGAVHVSWARKTALFEGKHVSSWATPESQCIPFLIIFDHVPRLFSNQPTKHHACMIIPLSIWRLSFTLIGSNSKLWFYPV